MSIIYNLKLRFKKLLPASFILLTHKIRAMAAVWYYGFPARKIRVIGVAGTKGKTTTVNLIARILEEAGFKAAMFSTANVKMAGEESLNTVKLTTPSPFFLQKFLADAIGKKCDWAVIEVSSHALDQHRLYGVDFKTIVITNLMTDHLDYHRNADEYRDIHLKMIGPKTEMVVINGEDKESQNLKQKIQKYSPKVKIISFGLGENDDLRCRKLEIGAGQTRFWATFKSSPCEIPRSGNPELLGIISQGEDLGEFALKIPGKFNVYNALAAIGAGIVLNVEPQKIKNALGKVESIPGRLENIKVGPEQNFQVIVDYAHSPDSLSAVYEVIKPHVKNRLIAVLGGTGDRDKTYRAKMGALADKFADIAIVTNEDPYSEDPEDIVDQVLSGIKGKKMGSVCEIISPSAKFPLRGISQSETLFRILDRKEAIRKAVNLAQKDDVILITGKGSEQFMVWGDKMIPWDDREKAREALKEKFKK